MDTFDTTQTARMCDPWFVVRIFRLCLLGFFLPLKHNVTEATIARLLGCLIASSFYGGFFDGGSELHGDCVVRAKSLIHSTSHETSKIGTVKPRVHS